MMVYSLFKSLKRLKYFERKENRKEKKDTFVENHIQ